MKNYLLVLSFALCVNVFAEAGDALPLKNSKSSAPAQTSPETHEHGKKGTPYVASVGVFGTSKLDEKGLRKFLGKDLENWLAIGIQGDPKSVEVEEKLAKQVREKYGFADAKWSVIQFFEPGNLAIHIVLDVVEKEDKGKRVAFRPEPKGEFKDPEGLIKSWAEYENLGLTMVEAGQLDPESDRCEGVAFHCPFGHKNEKLKKYEKIFVDGVKKHQEALAEILSKDKREDFRGGAAYLLAYAKDGQKVVQWMVDRVKDPSDLVRNNALRVLGDIAEFHPQYVIPVPPIVEAMNYPRATDRSKSVFVAHLMAMNAQSARDEILRVGVPNVLRLLASSMPDQREFSHGILRRISGKEFGPQDLKSWNQWAASLPKDRTVSGKKHP